MADVAPRLNPSHPTPSRFHPELGVARTPAESEVNLLALSPSADTFFTQRPAWLPRYSRLALGAPSPHPQFLWDHWVRWSTLAVGAREGTEVAPSDTRGLIEYFDRRGSVCLVFCSRPPGSASAIGRLGGRAAQTGGECATGILLVSKRKLNVRGRDVPLNPNERRRCRGGGTSYARLPSSLDPTPSRSVHLG